MTDDIEQQMAEAIQNNADSLSLYGGGKKGQLPETPINIPSLRHLSVTEFYADIPAWLAELTPLESLEIDEANSIRELLPHLWKLGRLRKLKLAYIDGLNESTNLPLSLAKLTYLEELNIDGADFEKFPTVVGSLSSLQSFSYEYCECKLPEVFDTLALLPRLKKLRLTHYAD